ncbi:MAG: hypothetical protein SFZ24_00410 [Planctomycetota bacterium]|nr:hypothetical protein [Planctomycetota bacterium]
MMKRTAEHRLERLRALRVRGEAAQALGPLMQRVREELRQVERKLGGVGAAWARVCPAELAARTSVSGLSRGVATILVRDASTKFELDRWLRSGGERELVRSCPTTLRKVKLELAGDRAGGAEPRDGEAGARFLGGG